MFPAYRAADAVITVCQDNDQRVVHIQGMNTIAEEALGYSFAALQGLPFTTLLPERIRQLLEEYVEFENDGNDVGAVLSKVQRFCVLHRDGKEIAYRLKVLRGEPVGGRDCFHLVLQSQADSRRNEAFRAVMRENFKGHEVLEPRTQLPDRPSIVKDIEFMRHYVNKHMLTASIAIVTFDQYTPIYEQHDNEAASAALLHIATVARQNLRGDDVAGCIGERTLALLLMDTTPDSARMVLNRLRWLIAATPHNIKSEAIPMTASIAFSMLTPDTERDILSRLEEQLDTQTGNSLSELSA